LKKEAEAKGFEALVAAGNSPSEAVSLLIDDKLEEIVAIQAKAIANIRIDKVTVWDGGKNQDGGNSTSNFVSGLYKSEPPLQEMFQMADMQLPEYLKGNELNESEETIKKPKGEE
jgi:flotillin